jgi:hypothetical protein
MEYYILKFFIIYITWKAINNAMIFSVCILENVDIYNRVLKTERGIWLITIRIDS